MKKGKCIGFFCFFLIQGEAGKFLSRNGSAQEGESVAEGES